jgi:hypothetical protein
VIFRTPSGNCDVYILTSVHEIAGQTRCGLPGRRRGLEWLGSLKSADDSFPLDFWFLEIDEKTKGPAGGPQIVETLRSVFVGKPLDALQFDHQFVFHEDVGKVLSHPMALVNHRKRDFGGSADAAKVDTSKIAPSTRSVKVSRYPRSSAFIGGPNPVPFSAGVLRIS